MVQELDAAIRQRGTVRSRRGLWRAAIASTFGVALLGLPRTSEAKKDRGKKNGKSKKVTLCHDGQTITVRKKAQKKHLKHGDTPGDCPSPPLPGASTVHTYQCPEPAEKVVSSFTPATTRFAQTFTATQSGSLRQIQFQIEKEAGSTGNYVVELLAAASNTPTNSVLATAVILNTSVPNGPTTLTATFAGPQLVAGAQYATALSRPGGSDLRALTREDNDCPGKTFAQQPSGSGAFDEIPNSDLVTSVTVLAQGGQPAPLRRPGSVLEWATQQSDMIENPGTLGDYLVQLLQVIAGTPGNAAADILAQVVVPDGSVLPGNTSPLIANFAGPALAAGTKYAAAVSRPGSSNFGVHKYVKNGPGCEGGNFFTSEDGGPFTISPTADDMVLSVFVI